MFVQYKRHFINYFFQFFIWLVLGTAVAQAASNKICYQGQLREQGVPITENKSMTFRIFTSSTGGSAVWNSGAQTISVVTGLFRALLEPTSVNWENTLYLEVEIEGTTLSPREELTASAYAINSQLLSGKAYTTAASSPTASASGELWFNTTNNTFNVWSGSSWDTVSGGGTGGGTVRIEQSDSVVVSGANTIDFSGSFFTITSGPTGEANIALDSSSVTLQGNSFNGNNQLIQLDGSGNLPALNGSALTNLSAIGTIEDGNASVVTDATNIDFQGSQFVVMADGGSEGDISLDGSSVTLQGNSFNGNNQLVQLDGSGRLTIGSGTPIVEHLSATASLDFGTLISLGCESLPITVTGASDGDTVYLGVPNSLASIGAAIFTAFVSAANTVTVKRCGLAVDLTNPSATTVRVDVWRH